jgi:hypothetical protein
MPDDAVPTDVMDTETRWRIAVHSPMKKIDRVKEIHKTFMDYLSCQEEVYITILHTNRFSNSTRQNIRVIQINKQGKYCNGWWCNTH